MSRILFYAPFDQRSRDTESLMIAFHKQGHVVICLTQQKGYLINDFLNTNGVFASSYFLSGKQSGWWYFLRHLIFFIRFCRKHNIEIVYSHLEPANFVASIGQYFFAGKTFLCRHHIDEAALQGFDKSMFYKITYALAKKIIVVSKRAAKYMIDTEKVDPSKIIKINLAYDFSLYLPPNESTVEKIKEQCSADLILVTICRFTKHKRADFSIRVLRKIKDSGINAKLILLGRGEEEEALKVLAMELGVSGRLLMPGYVSNVADYLAAADFLLHPSILESSCVTVKEAGITKLPVIVCTDIGDFNDYITSENGFMINKEMFVEEATEIILANYANKEKLHRMTSNLKVRVLEFFSIEGIIEQYRLLNSI